MSSFTRFNTTLKLQYIDNKSKDLWSVIDGFTFYSEDLKKGMVTWIYIPDGFITDGATIPRALWTFIPPLGKHGQAAVVHDYLREKGNVKIIEDGLLRYHGSLTAKEADIVFLEALKVLGVSWIKRTLMYLAVRAYAIVTLTK